MSTLNSHSPKSMTRLDRFQRLLDEHDIRHFSAQELWFRGDSDSRIRLNTDPPESLWQNIIPTIRVLEMARRTLNQPIVPKSIYRSPAYNRRIGGVPNSQHVQFRACDCQLRGGGGPRRLYDFLLHARRNGAFKGGLGLYSTFVHIDTRGKNATWRG